MKKSILIQNEFVYSRLEKMREDILSQWSIATGLSAQYDRFSKLHNEKTLKKVKNVEIHLWKTLKVIERLLGSEWEQKRNEEIKRDAEEAKQRLIARGIAV